MKKAILVADSGGTKTDWCLMDEDGNKLFFETDSYHPHLVNDNWIDSKKEFWKDYSSKFKLKVYFYGAGCSSEINQKKVQESFNCWGIDNVLVQSDIIGAAKASFGDEDGIIGILGTGSVIGIIENGKVKDIKGGFGYLLGDEGSAYYFGKLLIQAFLGKHFSKECENEIIRVLGDREAILKAVYGAEGKNFLSQLAKTFSTTEFQEIIKLHRKNIELFVERYLPIVNGFRTIFFIGSYAYFKKELLGEILAEKGWELGGVIQKPINKIAEYQLKTSF